MHVRELDPGDALAMARCLVLDVEVFPCPSIPRRPGLASRIWVASSIGHGAVEAFLASSAASRVRYLHGLGVAPGARRQGLARALLHACVRDAREASLSAVTLHVGVANREAIALYDSEGFVVRRVARGFYAAGVYPVRDAYEMVLPPGVLRRT
jgi:ribosomal protein S18 acetylase RimI-like enzyme